MNSKYYLFKINIKILIVIILISLFLFSTILKAIEQTWSDYEKIKYSPLVFEDISSLIGNGSFTNWYSEGKMDAGKKAHHYWIENYTDKGFFVIEYLAMPPGWHITGSGNDKKFITKKAEYLLNTKNNPLKRLKKRDIERHRDINNNVVAYVYFDFEGSSCIIFKKGYFRTQSGFVPSAHDSETLVGVFCKNSGTIDEIFAQQLIDSTELKQ